MKKKPDLSISQFPLSTTRSVEGTRRLAREKVLQILSAYDSIDSNKTRVFDHIFYRQFNLGESTNQPERLLKPEEIIELESDIPVVWRDNDVRYAKSLLGLTEDLASELDLRIERLAQNWDLERIAFMDRQLLRMALAEMMNFADIPARVTINEAIELAKIYSTEKSSVFINGLLDAARDELQNEGKLASKQTEADVDDQAS